MKRKTDLTVSTYGIARTHGYDVVLLPWGATEPHNLHLPYMTDCLLAHAIAADAAGTAAERYGVHAMVLPPVTMGSQNPGQRGLPFCIHARYETQRAILADTVDSLNRQGFSKLLIVNGHGGNNFKNMIRDLAIDHPDFFIASSEWFKQASPEDFFEQPGDHADELETSVMMHYHPELVDLSEAGDGRAVGFRAEALKAQSIWIPRHWDMVSRDTGIGNPCRATAEKGRRFAEAVVKRYAGFIRDFAQVRSKADLYEPWER